MKVAIVHDWLTVRGGAERVLERIMDLYPQAEIYTLIDKLGAEDRGFLDGRRVHTSFLQNWPNIGRYYRSLLPLFPSAISRWDLSEFDLVISSSFSVAKGVKTHKSQTHVCYIHSPARYIWDLRDQYLEVSGIIGLKRSAAHFFLDRLREWDFKTAQHVDKFIANSNFVRWRVKEFYNRDAVVVYPPVELDRFSVCHQNKGYFLVVSRLVPYKRVDLIVDAFAQFPDVELRVCGDGPEIGRIRHNATANVRFLGRLSDEEVTSQVMGCRAFVFAAVEDFGIAPLEAQACGKPVIAYRAGGVLETIKGLDEDQPSGVLFDEQTPECLAKALQAFLALEEKIRPENCRKNAERFSPETFDKRFATEVATLLG